MPSVKQIVARQIFGSKIGIILGNIGKNMVRYAIVYKIRPVKELLCRFGVCHKNCTKEHITKDGTVIMIRIDSGIFGLDTTGMLRSGELTKLAFPEGLKFDGFRGIELLENGKYRLWHPNFAAGKWEHLQEWTHIKNRKTGEMMKVEKRYSYYPFKDALHDMPTEILHDGAAVLVPAAEAVMYLQQWVKRTMGRGKGKTMMTNEPAIAQDTMGTMVGGK
jgi:hypothetical protein